MYVTVKHAAAPRPGHYVAQFTGAAPTPRHATMRYTWFVVSPSVHYGEAINVDVPTDCTPNNAHGVILSALLGRRLAVNEAVGIDPIVGQRYAMNVMAVKNGVATVQDIVPVT